MEARRTKNRNRNLFLPVHNQMADYMKIHDHKVQEYQNYLNYLHYNITNNSRSEHNHEFSVPPPTPSMLPFPPFSSPPPATPVTLAFSHLASTPPPFTPVSQSFSHPPSPTMNNSNQNEQYMQLNALKDETIENTYFGEEVNVWGPGLLGLFAKTPNQLETLSHTLHASVQDNLKLNRMKKPESIHIPPNSNRSSPISDICSPISTVPPGFEHTCSADIILRDEMFTGNRSI